MSGKTRNLPTEIFITGNWDANTNTTSYNDALESGIGNPDEKYRVTVAGNTNLDGINAWALNDIAYFDYYTRTWQKIDNQTNSGVTGSGTLNYIPLWTPSGTQLGNSIITQSAGGNAIQIGTTFLVDNTAKQVGINKSSLLAASLHIVGSGATSGTSSLIIQNATPTTLFEIKDDGLVGFSTATPRSTIHNAGSLTEDKITTVSTGTHAALTTEYIFNCTGTCTINLPASATAYVGKVYRIFAAEGVTVTVTPDGSDTIDGAASATVIGWGKITLRCLSAGNWRVGD